MTVASDIQQAAQSIRAGRLVAFPTETVYGLGANGLDAEAVKGIYAAKGRPETSPLILHVASMEMARALASEWPEPAERLARRYWPGPLTLVVKKAGHVPGIVTAGLDTVGIRMPDHSVALELIREAGVPLAAPSANRFGELSPTRAEHVRLPGVAMVLDGGPCAVGIESTVLSVAGESPVLLRPGMIDVTAIEALIGPVSGYKRETLADPSPGLQDRHYSPRTPMIFGKAPSSGRGAMLCWSAGNADGGRKVVAMPSDAARYATVVYDVLHRLDDEGLDWIAVEPPPDTPEWAGVRDRLQRAAKPAAEK